MTEPSPEQPADVPLSTWLLTDGRPGHAAQLRGLAQALSRRQAMDLRWVDVRQQPLSWLDALSGKYPGLATQLPPTLALAAGHGTHRHLLALGRACGCFTCVLMRPSLPLCCFDAAIIPAHDRPRQSPRVLVTQGVLNPIQPGTRANDMTGLILLGGPSSHFGFVLSDLCGQISALCRHFPEIEWTASSSRRTPAGTLQALQALGLTNLRVIDHSETPPGWVADMLERCAQAWITEDSVSMVYEALSAGLATGLIAMPALGRGRVQRGLDELCSGGMVSRLDAILAGGALRPPPQALQEAERAAEWLLNALAMETAA